MKLKTIVRAIALLGTALPVLAQQQPAPTQKVVITGSSIKRIQAEGALPMEVYTADDLDRNGIHTAEQFLTALSANGVGTDSAESNNNIFGTDTDRLTGGSANANLRALGPSGTLVLINGRRVATHGMSGAAVDLNAIPTAAIARVEVLKDGASAIYGADAIGGVINFILRTSYEGVKARLDYTTPLADGGGGTRRLSLLAGTGSLETGGFNVMGAFSIDRNDILRGRDRASIDGFQPERGLSPDSSSHPFANVLGAAGSALPTAGSVVSATDATKYTRINLLAMQNRCDAIETGVRYQPQLWNVTQASGGMMCNTDYGRLSMLQAEKSGYNFVGRGTAKIGANSTGFIEFLTSRTTVTSEFTPYQFQTAAAAGNFYPVGGPHYLDLKAQGVASFDPTKPIHYRWRMQDFGNRTIENVADNTRLSLGAEGDLGVYSYRLGLSTAGSEAWRNLIDGYAFATKLNDALKTGIINPWVLPGATQTPAAMDLIESTKARGRLDGGKTSLTQFDGSLSGPLMKLPAGSMDFAVGYDLRRETYAYSMEPGGFGCVSLITSVGANVPSAVMGCPGNPPVAEVSRGVGAVYGELAIPIFKSLDVQLALRHDRYSGTLGGTTNPKVAFRFQPLQQLLLRGSFNTGFKAPTFQQQIANFAPRTLTTTVNDPLATCPADDPTGTLGKCNIPNMPYTDSGDPNLKPETSKQGTLGIVVAPTKGLTVSADYWRVDLEERIRKILTSEILANYNIYSNLVERDPVSGNMSILHQGWVNAADSSTKGVDWNLFWDTSFAGSRWRTNINGTRMLSHKERTSVQLPLVEYVGEFGLRTLYLKDKVNAALTWSQGAWSVTGNALYKSAYKDQNMNTTAWKNTVADPNHMVGSYTIYGLYGSYTGFKGTNIQVGLRNLFDKEAPFSHHNVDDVGGAGYDARYASPVGRTFTLSASYTF